MTIKTTDNTDYYRRTGIKKADYIFDYVENQSNVATVLDAGCNNGDMSYSLQKRLKLKVHGFDLSNNLTIPDDYDFEKMDVVKYVEVKHYDITLFLSLYHHLLGAYSQDVADDVFYKLLLSSNKLIFDTGNVSESSRSDCYWFKAQLGLFKTEKELLDHFGIKYEKIDSWSVANGIRTLVSFDSKSFDDNVKVCDVYRRKIGSRYQADGLFNVKDIPTSATFTSDVRNQGVYYDKCEYYKLTIGSKYFFAKKHLDKKEHDKELINIKRIYNSDDEKILNRCIKFYGISNKFGFIYEWLDDIKYVRKGTLSIDGVTLKDIDIIQVNGEEKIIDFHW